jgi:hypothetical protein
MIDAVSSIVMTGRSMNGFDNPEENCTSFPAGVFLPSVPWRCVVGSGGVRRGGAVAIVAKILAVAVIVRSHR